MAAYRRLRKLSDDEEEIRIVSTKTKGSIIILDDEDEVQIVSVTKPVVACDKHATKVEDEYSDLEDFVVDDEGNCEMYDVPRDYSEDPLEGYLGFELDAFIKKLQKGESLRNLYECDPFLQKVRSKYLEWAWTCGRESGIQTLTLGMLKDIVCKSSVLSFKIPSIGHRPATREKCFACRMTRTLTRTLEGFCDDTRYLGAECADKLQCVFDFVWNLRGLSRGDMSERAKILNTLLRFEEVREMVWKKYK